MRIAAVFFPGRDRDKLMNIAKSLARGMEGNGHQVDLVDGSRDVNTKLTIYEYIAVGTEQTNFFGGKIPDRVGYFLREAGIVGGKKCFAFVLKKPVGSMKTLTKLMKVMEHEGMFLKLSDVISSTGEAQAIGKRLNIS
jgi:hypothetical protein